MGKQTIQFEVYEDVEKEQLNSILEKFEKEFLKVQEGFISKELKHLEGTIYSISIDWKSSEDANVAMNNLMVSSVAMELMNFINMSTISTNYEE